MDDNIIYAQQLCKRYDVEPITLDIEHLETAILVAKAVLPKRIFNIHCMKEKKEIRKLRKEFNKFPINKFDVAYNALVWSEK